jgi:hypothetical protein
MVVNGLRYKSVHGLGPEVRCSFLVFGKTIATILKPISGDIRESGVSLCCSKERISDLGSLVITTVSKDVLKIIIRDVSRVHHFSPSSSV